MLLCALSEAKVYICVCVPLWSAWLCILLSVHIREAKGSEQNENKRQKEKSFFLVERVWEEINRKIYDTKVQSF